MAGVGREDQLHRRAQLLDDGIAIDELPASRLLDASLDSGIEASSPLGDDVVVIDDRVTTHQNLKRKEKTGAAL